MISQSSKLSIIFRPSQSPTDYSILSPSYLTDLLTDELCNAVALLHFEVNVGEVEEEHLQQQFNYGENNKVYFGQLHSKYTNETTETRNVNSQDPVLIFLNLFFNIWMTIFYKKIGKTAEKLLVMLKGCLLISFVYYTKPLLSF